MEHEALEVESALSVRAGLQENVQEVHPLVQQVVEARVRSQVLREPRLVVLQTDRGHVGVPVAEKDVAFVVEGQRQKHRILAVETIPSDLAAAVDVAA